MKRLIIIIGVIVLVVAIVAYFALNKDVSAPISDGETTNIFHSQTGPLEFPNQTGANTATLPNNTNNQTLPVTISSTGITGISENATNTTFVSETKSLKRISDARVTSGQITVGTVKGLDIFVRYMEAGTGHVYDSRPVGDAKERVAGVTIPRGAETNWGNKGQSALLRYFNETGGAIKNYLVRFGAGATSTDKLTGTFISDNITDVAVAPVGEEHIECPAYLTKSLTKSSNNDPKEVHKLQQFLIDVENTSTLAQTGLFDADTLVAVKAFQTKYNIEATGNVGPMTRAKINSIYCAKVGGQVTGSRLAYVVTDGTGAKIVSSDFDDKVATNRFSSVLSEWRLLWPHKDSLAIVTAPSSEVAGYAYQLVGSTLKPLVWEVRGLTVLVSPKLDRVIYSQSALRGLRTLVKNLSDGSTRDFPLITLPQDKCAWSKINSNVVYCAAPTATLGGGYPDLWYQSQVSLNDNIYSVNLDTDTVTLLYSASVEDAISGDNISHAPDVENLIVAEDDSYLFFKNKKDGYLYQLPITGLEVQ